MKPIQDASQIVGDDNCNQTTNSSGSKALDENDLAEIEQIVKEKMVKIYFITFHVHLISLNCLLLGKTRGEFKTSSVLIITASFRN